MLRRLFKKEDRRTAVFDCAQSILHDTKYGVIIDVFSVPKFCLFAAANFLESSASQVLKCGLPSVLLV